MKGNCDTLQTINGHHKCIIRWSMYDRISYNCTCEIWNKRVIIMSILREKETLRCLWYGYCTEMHGGWLIYGWYWSPVLILTQASVSPTGASTILSLTHFVFLFCFKLLKLHNANKQQHTCEMTKTAYQYAVCLKGKCRMSKRNVKKTVQL